MVLDIVCFMESKLQQAWNFWYVFFIHYYQETFRTQDWTNDLSSSSSSLIIVFLFLFFFYSTIRKWFIETWLVVTSWWWRMNSWRYRTLDWVVYSLRTTTIDRKKKEKYLFHGKLLVCNLCVCMNTCMYFVYWCCCFFHHRMAIETIGKWKYTIETDYWSFGVLLWELFTVLDKDYQKHQVLPYEGIKSEEVCISSV